MLTETETRLAPEVARQMEASFQQLLKDHKLTVHHPVLPLPTLGERLATLDLPNGEQLLMDGLFRREKEITLMAQDPLRHGYQLDWWRDAKALLEDHDILLVLGGTDSTKSWFSSRFGVEMLVAEPNIEYAFFHSTEDSSKRQQQKIVHDFLPPDWRDLGKRGRSVNVSFSEKSGFTDNCFVLPNGSRGYFFFWRQEPGVITGYKLRGVSGDELATPEHIVEIERRLLGRAGKFVLTFTPVDGYTPAVGKFLAGAKILQTRPSRFLPGKNFDNRPEVPDGHMPYILQCAQSNAAVLCAFTEWSPFRKTGDLEKLIQGKSRGYVMITGYGWTEKTTGVAIPKFNDRYNVIIRSPAHLWNGIGTVPPKPWEGLYPRLPAIGTNRVVADPGGRKNWFIKWYRAGDKPPWHFVYREWPPRSTHGPWAEAAPAAGSANRRTRFDGYEGMAVRYEYNPAIIAYKRIILEAEGWVWTEQGWDGSKAETIFERYIDPRMGGVEVPTEEDGTSIIAMMEEEQIDEEGRVIGPAMIWYPAPGGGRAINNLQSLEIFNSYFDWNMEKPLSVLNCPHWYVVDACEQTIFAYKEYTGADGESGVLKDVMDPDWYYVKLDPQHADPKSMEVRNPNDDDEEEN